MAGLRWGDSSAASWEEMRDVWLIFGTSENNCARSAGNYLQLQEAKFEFFLRAIIIVGTIGLAGADGGLHCSAAGL